MWGTIAWRTCSLSIEKRNILQGKGEAGKNYNNYRAPTNPLTSHIYKKQGQTRTMTTHRQIQAVNQSKPNQSTRYMEEHAQTEQIPYKEREAWNGQDRTYNHGGRKASSLSNLLEDLINAMVALRISVLV